MSDMLIEGECSEETRNVMAELEGRIRGLEAVIAEIPQVTSERIVAAKERIREKARKRDGVWSEIKVQLNQPLDEHAEAEVDALAYMVENRQT